MPSICCLDCPCFKDKDQVQRLGAKCDVLARSWHVPSSLHPAIQSFNHWRPDGKAFLRCSHEKRLEVKQAGARWDPAVMAFHTCSRKGATTPPQFTPWLHPISEDHLNGHQTDDAYTKRDFDCGEAWDASAAVPHGCGNDIAGSCTNGKSSRGGNRRQFDAPSEWDNKDHFDENVPPGPGPSESKRNTANNSVTAMTQPVAMSHSNLVTAASKFAASMNKTVLPAKVNWSSVPRVSSKLTVAQLTHELLHRHPRLRGTTSGKPKLWFMGHLGHSSIWTTAPDLNHKERKAILRQPVVTSRLTDAQLKHELMSRGCPTPRCNNESKAELLGLVGEGSVWTAALETAPGPQTPLGHGHPKFSNVFFKTELEEKEWISFKTGM